MATRETASGGLDHPGGSTAQQAGYTTARALDCNPCRRSTAAVCAVGAGLICAARDQVGQAATADTTAGLGCCVGPRIGRMPGTFLRRGDPSEHRCEIPPAGHMGDTWQCDCGRRWYCWSARTERVGGGYLVGPHWRRRYWPWPRTARSKWVNLPESG